MMGTEKLIQIIAAIFQPLLQLFTGIFVGKKMTENSQVKAENKILKEHAKIDNSATVTNPLQAMANFKKDGKVDDTKKD